MTKKQIKQQLESEKRLKTKYTAIITLEELKECFKKEVENAEELGLDIREYYNKGFRYSVTRIGRKIVGHKLQDDNINTGKYANKLEEYAWYNYLANKRYNQNPYIK